MGVTVPKTHTEAVQRLATALATFIGVRLLDPGSDRSEVQTSLHVASLPGGKLEISIQRPETGNEIGPSLIVGRLVWELS
jgi:hypothetical protein